MCLSRPFDGTNLPALVHKIVEGSFDPIKGKYSDELKQLCTDYKLNTDIEKCSQSTSVATSHYMIICTKCDDQGFP
uniref:Uncharacterized protein n=1 Tax=Amphimedon queenslandica TaxID=400682 RepID=A0A1X7SUS7_AMPQE